MKRLTAGAKVTAWRNPITNKHNCGEDGEIVDVITGGFGRPTYYKIKLIDGRGNVLSKKNYLTTI